MRVFDAVKRAKEMLNMTDTPQLDAEVLLSFLLKKDRPYLYMNRNAELEEEIVLRFFNLIERRAKGEPIQYIVGKQEFMSLDFVVRPGVLIPRGDTEILVEEVLKKISSMSNPVIADVGCGSGAISIALAKYKGDAVVYALDIMDIPLEVTRINAKSNGVGDRVNVTRSDKLMALDEKLRGKIDVIVSNPPYIREDVIPTLMNGVRDFEPYKALSGGEDGLYFYREITAQSLYFLKEGGILAYETGCDQKNDVMSIMLNYKYKDIECFKDLAGLDRVIMGQRS